MRSRFDNELELLNENLTQMGLLVCDTIETAINAFKNHDLEMAKKVIESDSQIDSVEKMVEARALKLLLQQQPVARDLRIISTALKVITDMERIGDQAADIAEILMYYKKKPMQSDLSQVFYMAELAIEMVRGSVEAFTNEDLGAANRIILADDAVDNVFVEVRDSIIELLTKKRDLADEAIDIIMITKYLERIADHATNIAEWTIFAKTGEHKDERII